jgi:hypothetical protein
LKSDTRSRAIANDVIKIDSTSPLISHAVLWQLQLMAGQQYGIAAPSEQQDTKLLVGIDKVVPIGGGVEGKE